MTEPVSSTGLAERLAGLAGTTVTFLFTDIEESTPLLKRLGEHYAEVAAQHRRLLRAAFAAHGGMEVDTQGDAFFFVFRRARDAVAAARDAQIALNEHPWSEGVSVRVRMGLHSGEPVLHAEGLIGLSVVRGSRIGAAAHGGQVLVSEGTASLLRDELPAGLSLRDLGRQQLKGLDESQRIYQVIAPGLETEFPPIRVTRRRRLFAPAVLAGVALATIVVSVAALQLRDSGGDVIVPPNALAEIDPERVRVVGSIPVGKGPVGVAYAGGRIWVANADDATVSIVDSRGASTQMVSLGRPADAHPVAIAAGGAGVWVALGLERRLEQLDREFVGQVVGEPVSTAQEPLGVVVFGNRVCTAATVLVECFGTRDGRPAGSTPVIDAGATALAYGAQTIWVGGRDAVTQIAQGALEAVGVPVAVPGRVVSIAFGGGAVWVASVTQAGSAFGAGSISRIALGASAPSLTVQLDGRPTAIAHGERSVWVSVDNGTVLRLDPRNGAVASTIEVGGQPAALAVGGGRVWVAIR